MVNEKDFIVHREKHCVRKWYKHRCDSCSKDLGYRRKRPSWTGMCRTCFNVTNHTQKNVSDETRKRMSEKHYLNNGGTHHFTGKRHLSKTKKILSEKQTLYCKNNGNQFKMGKSKGVHSLETRCKLSAFNSGKEPKWKGRTFDYIGVNRRMKLRSSYELFYAGWLDANSIQWEYEPRYTLSNGMSFSPDFKIFKPTQCGIIVEIIEIKGYWTDKAKAKWKLFKEDYSEIEKKVLMKDDLIKLGMK